MKEIYLDSAATTRVKNEVVKEMEKYFSEDYGNPSSKHEMGERARGAMNAARKVLATMINAKGHEIIFTSGGTESNNLALIGLTKAYPAKKKILVSAIEHPSVLDVCSFLKKKDHEIVKIPVNSQGVVRLDVLKRELEKDSRNVLVVSVMQVNNIIGTIEPIEEIGRLCTTKKVLFHCDAVQGFTKLSIDVRRMRIDLLSASAHKIGGPKGIGFLYIREGIGIKPLMLGGGQERGLRSGTENVPAIIGFSKAALLSERIGKEKIERTQNRMVQRLQKIGGTVTGSSGNRVSHIIHVSFPNIMGETLVQFLSAKGIFVSTGSACESNKERDDYVLEALGLSKKERNGSIRISLNEDVSLKDVDYIVGEIESVLKTFEGKGI